MYGTISRGTPNSLNHRIYVTHDSQPISPIHDIPLWIDRVKCLVNMVVEIPRWTNPKMEMSLEDPLNPLRQDTNGKLRFVHNCFPFHGVPWNYGGLPQTLVDPNSVDDLVGLQGDGDCVDIIEMGQRIPNCGDVIQVKILGAFALIDRNKTDWKLIAVNVEDEIACVVNDLEDLHRNFPNLLNETMKWFQLHKVVAGKPENKFAFNGNGRDRETAVRVVETAHNYWKSLVQSRENTSGVSCSNVRVFDSPFNFSAADAEAIIKKSPLPGNPQPRDPEVDRWHFV